jgi:hypothetical protein
MTDREKLASDLMAAERVIQWNAQRNPSHAAYAKQWLVELEARAACLRGLADQRRG